MNSPESIPTINEVLHLRAQQIEEADALQRRLEGTGHQLVHVLRRHVGALVRLEADLGYATLVGKNGTGHWSGNSRQQGIWLDGARLTKVDATPSRNAIEVVSNEILEHGVMHQDELEGIVGTRYAIPLAGLRSFEIIADMPPQGGRKLSTEKR